MANYNENGQGLALDNIHPVQKLQEDCTVSNECMICGISFLATQKVFGYTCPACAPTKLKFLEVGPHGNAPEGTYRVRVNAIKPGNCKEPGHFITVDNKLNLLSGYTLYKELMDGQVTRTLSDQHAFTTTVTVVNNNGIRPRLIKDLKLGMGLRAFEDDEMFATLKASIAEHGMLNPINITSDGRVIDGLHRLRAAQALGMHSVPCKVVGGSEAEIMKQVLMTTPPRIKTNPLEYAKALDNILNRNPKMTIEDLAKQLNVNADWIRAKPLSSYTGAGSSTKVEVKGPELIVRGEKIMSPSERGKVRCLNPGCKTWIPNAKEFIVDREAGDWFCKKHKLITLKPATLGPSECPHPLTTKVRGFEDFPLADRDGDSIWIMKTFDVVKIRNMEDSHLTNTLVFLEANAKKRCQLTGLPESKWLAKAGPRYPLLLDEAKRRDEKLKCACDDGILQISITDPETLKEATETSICGNCVRGEDRRKAKLLANTIAKEAAKRKKSFTIQVATMMIVALLAGGSYYGGLKFVTLVASYLSQR